MKTRNFRVCSKSSTLAGQVDQENRIGARNGRVDGLLETALRTSTCGRQKAGRVGQKEL